MREPDGGKTAILAEAGGISGRADASRRGCQTWTEWLAPGAGATLADISVLAAVRTAHQQVEIGENAAFGRIFRLDGRVMSTERDAFIQHELMTVPMACVHGSPRTALVVGGGDGLGLMEAFARAGRQFDLIVYDLTEADDGSPAAALFSPHGLQTARRCLAAGGAMSLHLGPLWHRPDTARLLLSRVRQVFAHVAPLTTFVPAYGALLGIALASDALDIAACPVERIAARLRQWKLDTALRAYHAALHPTLFTHPRHLQAIFDSACRPA